MERALRRLFTAGLEGRIGPVFSSRRPGVLAALAAYALITIAMMTPYVSFDDITGASYEGDQRLIIWTLAWNNHAVLTGTPLAEPYVPVDWMVFLGLADLVYKRGAAAGIKAHQFIMLQGWFFAPAVMLYGLVTGTPLIRYSSIVWTISLKPASSRTVTTSDFITSRTFTAASFQEPLVMTVRGGGRRR